MSWIQNFDYIILSFYHSLALLSEGKLNPVFRFMSFLCDSDKFFPIIIIAIILLIFKKTRKVGLAMLVSMVIGVLITNLAIKNLVARPRPYQANELFHSWWLYAGARMEGEFSFPSGHVTAAMCSAMAILFYVKSPWKWASLIVVVLIGMSRNYLMVHYPTDVLGGIVVGIVSGILAKKIIDKIIQTKKLSI